MTRLTVEVDGLRIGESYPVRLMGIINLSPESFYKGTMVTESLLIRELVTKMEMDGADIIDVGAASTAPTSVYGNPIVSEEEELKRIMSALSDVLDSTNLPVSIDTTSSKVAEEALDLGAAMVNDVTGLQRDSRMASLVSSRGIPVVIMANCGVPCDSLQASLDSLVKSLLIVDNAGINRENVIVDPGIGFGKPAEVDFEILHRLEEYNRFNQPLLVGVSRKAFIGSLLGQKDPGERLYGSLAATTIAVYNGARVIRTHDIKETRMAVQIGEAIRRG